MLDDSDAITLIPYLLPKPTFTMDSDSDTDDCEISVRDSGSSDMDIGDDEDDIETIDPIINPEMVKENSFVLVKFNKKKCTIYYVGKVLQLYNKTEYRVTYLRKKPDCWNFI